MAANKLNIKLLEPSLIPWSPTKPVSKQIAVLMSGGVDSTYTAYVVKEQLGLRPLAVHLDNGWDAELAVKNIENVCDKLDIDLHTHVIDWEEFRDLQLAFLKASTPDSEIPTDHAIVASLYTLAAQHHVKFILSGMNAATESIMPLAWSQGHMDWKYIKAIHTRFGTKPLKIKQTHWA